MGRNFYSTGFLSVFKYVRPERIDILQKALIRFTPAISLNDPFEIRPFFEAFVPDNFVRDEVAKHTATIWETALSDDNLKYAYDQLPNEQRALMPFEVMAALARAADPEETKRDFQSQLDALIRMASRALTEFTPKAREMFAEKFRGELGILSLSEVPDSELMWSHYADSHKGFVIEFDESHPWFDRRRSEEDEFYHLRQVVYQKERPRHAALVNLDSADVFLAKGAVWSYERERRVLAPLNLADAVIGSGDAAVHLYAVPPDCITGVILGASMLAANREAIMETVRNDSRYRHVRIREAFVDEDGGGIAIRTL